VPVKIAKVSHELYAVLETNPDGSGDVDEDDRVDVNGEEPDSDDEDHYPNGDPLPMLVQMLVSIIYGQMNWLKMWQWM
jgi:hypothetical protein